MSLSIVPFVNKVGEPRFKIVGSKGNTFIDAFSHGYYTKTSAYYGLKIFNENKKK